jgi:hypothetical protein
MNEKLFFEKLCGIRIKRMKMYILPHLLSEMRRNDGKEIICRMLVTAKHIKCIDIKPSVFMNLVR